MDTEHANLFLLLASITFSKSLCISLVEKVDVTLTCFLWYEICVLRFYYSKYKKNLVFTDVVLCFVESQLVFDVLCEDSRQTVLRGGPLSRSHADMDGRHSNGGWGIHTVFELTPYVRFKGQTVSVRTMNETHVPSIMVPKLSVLWEISLLICNFTCLLCVFSLLYRQ